MHDANPISPDRQLRSAARLMHERAENSHVGPTWHAVAGFLEAIAARSHRQVTDCRYPNPEDIEWAEQIARAFLYEPRTTPGGRP